MSSPSHPLPVRGPLRPIPPPGAPRPDSRLIDGIAVLVDVDNVQAQLDTEGQPVSWGRLKDFLRGLGPLSFSDAFTSPRSFTSPVALWDAGFDVIACPMAAKDKDDVDEKIRNRALRYLFLTGISRIVIVSDDRDFLPLVAQAADRGKTVELVSPLRIAPLIVGTDPPHPLDDSRQMRRFLRAISDLRAGNPQTGDPNREFLAAVATRARVDLADGHGRALRGVKDRIRPHLFPRWGRHFRTGNIADALKALVRSGAFQLTDDGMRLNDAHDLWQRIPP